MYTYVNVYTFLHAYICMYMHMRVPIHMYQQRCIFLAQTHTHRTISSFSRRHTHTLKRPVELLKVQTHTHRTISFFSQRHTHTQKRPVELLEHVKCGRELIHKDGTTTELPPPTVDDTDLLEYLVSQGVAGVHGKVSLRDRRSGIRIFGYCC